MSEATPPHDTAHELVERDFRLMERWDDAEASAIIAPTMHNDESVAEPPAARQPGVAGARATYDWLTWDLRQVQVFPAQGALRCFTTPTPVNDPG